MPVTGFAALRTVAPASKVWRACAIWTLSPKRESMFGVVVTHADKSAHPASTITVLSWVVMLTSLT